MAMVTSAQELKPGTRVRVLGRRSAGLTLTADTGTIVRPDPFDEGYFIIRMDKPALHHCADGRTESLSEIVKYWDNLEVLPPGQ